MIHLCLVESLLVKICVLPILVGLELDVNLAQTDLVETDLSVLALLALEEIHWCLAQEVNVKMTVNVPLLRLVSTSNVRILAKMLVELVPIAKQLIMVLFAPVPMALWVIP